MISAVGSPFYSYNPTHDQSHLEDVLDVQLLDTIQKLPTQEKKERIFELVYDFFRTKEIDTARGFIQATFFKHPFSFYEDEFEECFALHNEEFPVAFSRQICNNAIFLRFNLPLVIRHVLPLASADENCFFEVLNIASISLGFGFEKIIEEPFKSQIEHHYKKLFLRVVDDAYINNAVLKTALAKVVFEKDPDFLSGHFLYLFNEEEIFVYHPFCDILQGIYHGLVERMKERCDDVADYFKKTQMYLERWFSTPLLRSGGFAMVAAGLRAKEGAATSSAGSSRPVDAGLPRDTPMWREIGFLETDQGIDRIFKLDWDFDSITQPPHSSHCKSADVAISGTTDDLVDLLFPAIVTRLNGNLFDQWWARILGYRMQKGGNGIYMTLPEPSTLMKRIPLLFANEGARGKYQGFTLKEGAGGASLEEFIQAFKTYDCYCSTTTEFVHDHLLHLLRTLKVIMENTAEEYSASLRLARAWLSFVEACVQPSEGEPLEEWEVRMLEVMKINLGIFADAYTSFSELSEREKFINEIFQGKKWTKIWSGPTGHLWREVFRVGEEITVTQIQDYWDQIVKEK